MKRHVIRYQRFFSISSRRPLSPVYVYMGCSSLGNTAVPITEGRYIPRGRNELHNIFDHHFQDFCRQYDEKYASKYSMFRLKRIQQIREKFSTCGDYMHGIVRIRCTNPECGSDYFRPFSCKGFYLCPSCCQKRTLLFAEHLTNAVLLNLPHRQFVFTFLTRSDWQKHKYRMLWIKSSQEEKLVK